MEVPRFEDQPGESELCPELIYLDQEFQDFHEKERTQKSIENFFMRHDVYLRNVDSYTRSQNSNNRVIYAIISREGDEIIENFSEITHLVAETSDSPSQTLETTADLLSKERIARGLAFDKMSVIRSYNPADHTPEFFYDKLLELSRLYPDPAERHAKLIELYGLDLQLTTAKAVLQYRQGKEYIKEAELIVTEFEQREDIKKAAKSIGETALNAAETAGTMILVASLLAQASLESLKYKLQRRRFK